MLPSRIEAEQLLSEAELYNPGAWGAHSRIAAYCAEIIASNCPDLDSNKAYILGLLHDIGRKFGIKHLAHVYDGYVYMQQLGYDEAARVCLTHSFNNKSLDDYVGKADTTQEEYVFLQSRLAEVEFDEYDRLLQLCDALAGSESILNVEERMLDVKNRYGYYPQTKWNQNLALLSHFEAKVGQNIYTLLRKRKDA